MSPVDTSITCHYNGGNSAIFQGLHIDGNTAQGNATSQPSNTIRVYSSFFAQVRTRLGERTPVFLKGV
jgi:hypothetical protein